MGDDYNATLLHQRLSIPHHLVPFRRRGEIERRQRREIWRRRQKWIHSDTIHRDDILQAVTTLQRLGNSLSPYPTPVPLQGCARSMLFAVRQRSTDAGTGGTAADLLSVRAALGPAARVVATVLVPGRAECADAVRGRSRPEAGGVDRVGAVRERRVVLCRVGTIHGRVDHVDRGDGCVCANAQEDEREESNSECLHCELGVK